MVALCTKFMYNDKNNIKTWPNGRHFVYANEMVTFFGELLEPLTALEWSLFFTDNSLNVKPKHCINHKSIFPTSLKKKEN